MIVAQLLFLEAENSKKPIHMYINSPGGGARLVGFPSEFLTLLQKFLPDLLYTILCSILNLRFQRCVPVRPVLWPRFSWLLVALEWYAMV